MPNLDQTGYYVCMQLEGSLQAMEVVSTIKRWKKASKMQSGQEQLVELERILKRLIEINSHSTMLWTTTRTIEKEYSVRTLLSPIKITGLLLWVQGQQGSTWLRISSKVLKNAELIWLTAILIPLDSLEQGLLLIIKRWKGLRTIIRQCLMMRDVISLGMSGSVILLMRPREDATTWVLISFDKSIPLSYSATELLAIEHLDFQTNHLKEFYLQEELWIGTMVLLKMICNQENSMLSNSNTSP